ncbi:unnamed protein product [Calicophoron daubneyi]|uniref:Uncharacterized protein n=1 Tax=Calicophoron daubneyi TaxID=300641 RepID=A0AAV2TF46_CALDB
MQQRTGYYSAYDQYGEVINAIEQDCPDLLPPHLAVPGKPTSSAGDKLITENTVLDSKNRRNLLHMAAIRSAHKCVTLLVSPPYSWDPDRPDALGWTPFQIAEDQDDFPTVCALGMFSRELRGPAIERTGTRKYGTLSTCLLWPQLYRARNVHSFKFLKGSTENQGRTDKESPLIRFLYANLGRRMQLTFELLLSDPELLHPKLTTGETEQAHTQHFSCWPLKVSKFADHNVGQSSIEVHPESFDHIWLQSVLAGGSTSQSFTNLYESWTHCRLLQPNQEHTVLGHSWVPPSLKEFCRICLRRALVNSMTPCEHCCCFPQE